MSIDMQQFNQTFFEESLEGLDVMENELLNLDAGAADKDAINTIFRAAHSIKGGSGTFGFTAIASFTHVLETLLDQMRDGVRDVTSDAVNLMLQAVDCLRDLIAAAKDEADIDKQKIATVQKQLEDMLDTGASNMDLSTGQSGAAATGGDWYIYFRPAPELLQTGNDPVRILHELSALGDLNITVDSTALPGLEEMNPEDSYLAWEMKLTGNVTEEQIREIFEWVEDECELTVTKLSGDAATPAGSDSPATDAPAQTAAAARSGKKPASGDASSIRVGIDKVDAIINLVGELVITQSMLGQMGAEFEECDNYEQARIEKLRDGLAQLERNTRELQESVMRIRMLPIGFVFNRFPRLVHDMSQKLGKNIELKISGEGTELDKTVMEKIGDPLVHMVRNSLDHGIEMPEDRVAAGKPETGVLHLNAYHKGGNIVIEINDDGRGLDKEKILAKARNNGVINEEQTLSDDEINDLIFQPGFSTAEQVSDISGRGVGMDVVRRNIKELGGSVEIQSSPGKGSKFTIRLPLTLAILDGQLVRVGDETFVIPLVSIIESLQIKPEKINAIAGKAEVYKLRDEYIPIIRLYEVFDVEADNTSLDNGLMVVVEGDGEKAGIIVDDLLAQQQVVIKSLETNFKRIEGVSGATILGDGTVALIMDIPGLVNFSKTHQGPGAPTPPTGTDSDKNSDTQSLDTQAA